MNEDGGDCVIRAVVVAAVTGSGAYEGCTMLYDLSDSCKIHLIGYSVLRSMKFNIISLKCISQRLSEHSCRVRHFSVSFVRSLFMSSNLEKLQRAQVRQ